MASPAVTGAATEVPAEVYTDLDTLIEQTFARTASLGGIVPTEKLIRVVVTRDEMTQKQLAYLEKTRIQFGQDEELYEFLGLIPDDLDLFGLVVALFTAQGLVFYDSESRVMYIAQDYGNLGPRIETHLVKEYMHALQQQYFGAARLENAIIGNFEGELALVTVLEADARATQTEYAITHFTPELYRQLLSAGTDNPAFMNVPYVIRHLFDFAFTEGADLIKSLLLSGGWPAVNNVLNNPPVSTEQIIHPEKYSIGETPITVALPDLIEALGPGWGEISNNVMGEFILKTYLEDQSKDEAVDPELAAASAAGWGGDRFAILESPSGGKFLAWLVVWDSVADAQEFNEFATAYTDIPQRGFIGIQNDRVLVVLGPSEEPIATIRAQFPGF